MLNNMEEEKVQHSEMEGTSHKSIDMEHMTQNDIHNLAHVSWRTLQHKVMQPKKFVSVVKSSMHKPKFAAVCKKHADDFEGKLFSVTANINRAKTFATLKQTMSLKSMLVQEDKSNLEKACERLKDQLPLRPETSRSPSPNLEDIEWNKIMDIPLVEDEYVEDDENTDPVSSDDAGLGPPMEESEDDEEFQVVDVAGMKTNKAPPRAFVEPVTVEAGQSPGQLEEMNSEEIIVKHVEVMHKLHKAPALVKLPSRRTPDPGASIYRPCEGEGEAGEEFLYAKCDIAFVVFRELLEAILTPVSTLCAIFKESATKTPWELEAEMVKQISEMIQLATEAFHIEERQANKMLESLCEANGFGAGNLTTTGKIFHPREGNFSSSENRINYLTRMCQDRVKSIIQCYKDHEVLDPRAFENGEQDLVNRRRAEVKFYEHILMQLENGVQTKFTERPKPKRKRESFSVAIHNELVQKQLSRRGLFCSCFGASNGPVQEEEDDRGPGQDGKSPDAKEETSPAEKHPDEQLNTHTDVKGATFRIDSQEDMRNESIGHYLLLAKVLTQHANADMVTPEENDFFVYDLGAIKQMRESMSIEASKGQEVSKAEAMAAKRQQTELRFQNTDLYFEASNGQHSLKGLKPMSLLLLQNYAHHNNVSLLHNTMLLVLTWLQNFRGATSTLFQPQKHMNEHVFTLLLYVKYLNQVIGSCKVLSAEERVIIEQRIVITLESIVDDAVANYHSLFAINDRTGFDCPARKTFENLLGLNNELYRLIFILSKEKHGPSTVKEMAEDAMWEDVKVKLQARAKFLYRSFRVRQSDPNSSSWEFRKAVRSSLFAPKHWTPFSADDADHISKAYLNSSVNSLTLPSSMVVSLKDFTVRYKSGNVFHVDRIRGKVNGEYAYPVNAEEWGSAYSVTVVDTHLDFSITSDEYTRDIVIETVDDAENRRGGMEAGDRLAFLHEWPCAGKPLAAVYQKLATMRRPLVLRLHSAKNRRRECKGCTSFVFDVTIEKLAIDNAKHLGLRLGRPKDGSQTRVVGFVRKNENRVILPAELSNQIRSGDLVNAVNGVDVSTSETSHQDVVRMISENDVLTFTLERFYDFVDDSHLHSNSLSAEHLIEMIEDVRAMAIEDEKYHSRIVYHFLKNSTSLLRRHARGRDLNLVGVNLLSFYDLIIEDVELWMIAHPPTGSAKEHPSIFITLHNTLKQYESDVAKWNGPGWKNRVRHYLDLEVNFGHYVVSWIEKTYLFLTSQTIPNMFAMETWEMDAGPFPYSSGELLIILNGMIQTYLLLPNHHERSNVTRFGEQGVCNVFKAYANQVLEDFEKASIALMKAISDHKQSLEHTTSASVTKSLEEEAKTIEKEFSKLCARINSIFRCHEEARKVLKGLNAVKGVAGFLTEWDDVDDGEDNDCEDLDCGDHFDDSSIGTEDLCIHRVRVRVISATSLPKLDYGGLVSSDPFVEMRVYEQQVKEGCWYDQKATTVQHSTQKPTWNENFEFYVVRRDAMMKISVVDYSSGNRKPRLIGTASLCMGNFFYEDEQAHAPPQNFKLVSATGEAAGQIKLLIVSRSNEMFPPLSVFLNNACVTMLSNKSWGLVDSLQPDIIEIVRSILFYQSNPIADVSVIDQDFVEVRLERLYIFFDEHLTCWCDYMCPEIAAKTIVRSWRVVMDSFTQLLLPTLDRSYLQMRTRKPSKSSPSRLLKNLFSHERKESLPEPKDRVESVTYLNSGQNRFLRIAHDLMFEYFASPPEPFGLTKRMAEINMGKEFCMLSEMWDNIEYAPEAALGKVGQIMGQMVEKAEKARVRGWDSRAGREWEDLRLQKDHLHHVLLFCAMKLGNEQAQYLIDGKLFKEEGKTTHGRGYDEGQAW